MSTQISLFCDSSFFFLNIAIRLMIIGYDFLQLSKMLSFTGLNFVSICSQEMFVFLKMYGKLNHTCNAKNHN